MLMTNSIPFQDWLLMTDIKDLGYAIELSDVL